MAGGCRRYGMGTAREREMELKLERRRGDTIWVETSYTINNYLWTGSHQNPEHFSTQHKNNEQPTLKANPKSNNE